MKKYLFTIMAALLVGVTTISTPVLPGPSKGGGAPIIVFGPPEGDG